MYCTVTDVEAHYLGKNFECGDYVTPEEVEAFIRSESAGIDAIIGVRYSLPVTASSDLMILKSICEKLVVATVDDIVREKSPEGKFERQRNTRKDAQEWLKMIQDGRMRLNASQNSSVITFNKTTSADEDVEKRFKDSNIEPRVSTLDRERRRYR